MIWHKETQQTMLDLCNHAPKNMKKRVVSWLKMAWKCSLRGAPFLGKMPVSDGVCCTKMGDECCGDGRKNDDRYRKKKSAVTICKLDYLVCISLIYSVLWKQWNLRAYIVEIKMIKKKKKMMTQSVKIVKVKGVILLIFNTLV